MITTLVLCVCLCECACVGACVREREREREAYPRVFTGETLSCIAMCSLVMNNHVFPFDVILC